MSHNRGFRQAVIEPSRQEVAGWQMCGWFGDTSPLCMAFLALRDDGRRATLLHRMAYWAAIRRIPLLPGVLANLNSILDSIELTPHGPIGPGPYMPHAAGTVMNARGGGANVEIQGCVTVGLNGLVEFPVAAGCRVLGNVALGSGARVGANALVLKDVDPGQTVVGVPACPIGAKA